MHARSSDCSPLHAKCRRQRHHRTGAAHRSGEELIPSRTLGLVENLLAPITRIEFTSDDAIAYATIRSKLERAGSPIGPLDIVIAAQAVARRLVLVSSNEREFNRVPGLTPVLGSYSGPTVLHDERRSAAVNAANDNVHRVIEGSETAGSSAVVIPTTVVDVS